MEEIEQSLLRIREPSEEDLACVLNTLSKEYEAAYGSAPGQLPVSYRADKQMRHYVRSWITTWDFNRVAPTYQPDIEVESTTDDYREDELLEKATEDNGQDERGAAS